MVIALMAFAIVAFLLLIDTAVMPSESNKNTANVNKKTTTTVNQNDNTNSTGTTEGTFLTNTDTTDSDTAE